MIERGMILKAMIERGEDGHVFAYISRSTWGKEETGVCKDGSVRLTEAEAKPFVDDGLFEYQSSGTVGWNLTPKGIVEASKLVKIPMLDLKALLDYIFGFAYFCNKVDGEVPIPYVWSPGSKHSKLVLVLGENAGGKSFFRRLVSLSTYKGNKRERIKPGRFPVREMIHLSMDQRCGGGVESAFIYGDEQRFSTGALSANTVTMGTKTILGQAHRVLGYWDEPDIGMSSGSAAGAGVALRGLLENDPPFLQGLFVTSHSPALVRNLTAGLKYTPHYVFLGDDKGPASIAEWLQAQQNPKPVTPEELQDIGIRRFKRIQAILNRK